MKFCFLILLLILSLVNLKGKAQTSTYKIITEFAGTWDGIIDTTEIKRLDDPLKALTAFYSALAGTNCDTSTCDLTTALGLGTQGSDAHKALIKKYFPNDKLAKEVVAQNCYLRPDGASTFSEYCYLTITTSKGEIKVDFKVYFYDHGNDSYLTRQDTYLFQNHIFKVVKRKIIKQGKK